MLLDRPLKDYHTSDCRSSLAEHVDKLVDALPYNLVFVRWHDAVVDGIGKRHYCLCITIKDNKSENANLRMLRMFGKYRMVRHLWATSEYANFCMFVDANGRLLMPPSDMLDTLWYTMNME